KGGAWNGGGRREGANKRGERVMAKLGASTPDAMRALTAEKLLTGTLLEDNLTPDPQLGMAYQPVIDGAVMPKPAIEMVADGMSSKVAIMAGSTLEEWKLFAAMDAGAATLDRTKLAHRFGWRLGAEATESIITAYEKARGARG